ncbi:6288_t:CDS:1 [Ambispora leptoticha]|uniref:6288_t:CDS:1 n=1 Tax=Ambispora leptoticha TaxID=144679 RepID=A0A9N8W3V9_9GLOM|nr:6288_t:CDS:1 [Ambispora leptoticha]
MTTNTNQANFLFTDDNRNLLRYSYLVDKVNTRLDELHHTEQQINEPIDIWSNFTEGSDLPLVNEVNVLPDSFNSDIPIIEVESVEFDLYPNLSSNNEVSQGDQENFFTDNHHDLLRNFYLIDEVNTRLDELGQQNNEPIDIWSDFIRGSDLPILNEENTWLDLNPISL